MAMTVGGGASGKTVAPMMNVTPLIDVVLVLLIIFMVITPLLSKTFWVHLPKQEKEEVAPEDLQQDPEPPLVMKLGPGRTITINNAEIAADELVDRLKRMFAARSDHVLFFDATDDVEYGFAVEMLDRAREGHAVTIAPLTTALAAPDDATPAAEPPPAEPPAAP
jgi:biopolymer transport protein ExbD/biopolymer transport protein TolR